LAAGILLSVPLALVYDLLIVTVAIGWLVRAGRGTGFLPWEKLVLFGCFVVPLVSCHLGQATRIPVGPLAPATLLVLALVRTLRAVPKADRVPARQRPTDFSPPAHMVPRG
jgi:hypothetical protein